MLSTCLTLTAQQLANAGLSDGLWIGVEDRDSQLEISVSAQGLPESAFVKVSNELAHYIGDEPTASAQAVEDAIKVTFTIQ